jgi:hypothetical protein
VCRTRDTKKSIYALPRRDSALLAAAPLALPAVFRAACAPLLPAIDELISLCPLSPGQARDQDKRAAGTGGDMYDTAQTIMLSPTSTRRF